jgi:hypothetical protein
VLVPLDVLTAPALLEVPAPLMPLEVLVALAPLEVLALLVPLEVHARGSRCWRCSWPWRRSRCSGRWCRLRPTQG